MTRLIDADELEKKLPNDLPYKASVKRVLIQAPTVEAYSAEAVKQIMWERDMAIQQLNDYGVQLGEKADCVRVVRCKDCDFKRINSFAKESGIAHCTLHKMVVALDDFCNYGEHEDGD